MRHRNLLPPALLVGLALADLDPQAIGIVGQVLDVERERIRYVADLQAPPLARAETRFVHFYGDRATPLLPRDIRLRVLQNFAAALPFWQAHPDRLPLMRWCAIQSDVASEANQRRDPDCFGYEVRAQQESARAWSGDEP